MSCEQRENGVFKFKKSGYNKVMREVRKMLQSLDDYNFEIAVKIYEVLKENKVKKNYASALEWIEDQIKDKAWGISHKDYQKVFKSKSIKNDYNLEIDKECVDLALNEIFRNNNNTILKPRRSKYPKLTNKDKSFQKTINNLFTLNLSEKDSVLVWSVNSGNRTVDRATEHSVTKALFNILDNYKWSYGEGGKTVMVSENFDDDPCTPDELPEITRKYEKLTQKEQKNREKRIIEMAKIGMYY